MNASLVNVEAEAALLGAMMIERSVIDAAADIVAVDDFAEPVHGRIFEVVLKQYALGKSTTPVGVKDYFDGDPALESLGGNAYLARLTADGQGLLAPRLLAEQVKDLSQRRQMQAGLMAAASACGDLDAAISEIVSHADAAMTVNGSSAIHQPTGGEAFDDLIADFDRDIHGVNSGVIPSLDNLLGGGRPSELIILAARPGMGKTAVAGSYGLGAAYNGHGVLFVTLEMSAKELAGRMAADLSYDGENGVPYAAIRDRRLNDWQRRKVSEARDLIHSLPFQIVDTGSLKVGSLNMLIRRHKRRMAAKDQKLELVIVDYLQLLNTDHRLGNRYEAVSEVSRALKAMAKDHGVTILALAQLSREVEKRPDKRPELSDLKESGQIEQDADVVVFLLRQEHYLRLSEPDIASVERIEWEQAMDAVRGQIEFIVAKNRRGVTGNATGKFHGAYQAVR